MCKLCKSLVARGWCGQVSPGDDPSHCLKCYKMAVLIINATVPDCCRSFSNSSFTKGVNIMGPFPGGPQSVSGVI